MWVLQQENDPKQMSKLVCEYIKKTNIRLLRYSWSQKKIVHYVHAWNSGKVDLKKKFYIYFNLLLNKSFFILSSYSHV